MELHPNIQDQDKNQHPARRVLAVAVTAAGMLLAATGCNEEKTVDNTFAQSCGRESVAVPNGVSPSNIADERVGNIFACDYFNDMRLPYNEPTALVAAVNNGTRTAQSRYNASSNIGGGFGMILGTGGGGFNGSSKAQGYSKDWEVTTIQFENVDGVMQTAELPSEKVQLKFCEQKDCEPNVTINIPTTPLYVKPDRVERTLYYDDYKDSSSIWSRVDGSKVVSEYFDNSNYHRPSLDDARKFVMSQVLDEEGNPASVGKVIAALSTGVVLEIPAPTK